MKSTTAWFSTVLAIEEAFQEGLRYLRAYKAEHGEARRSLTSG